jgi:hypothetical protein
MFDSNTGLAFGRTERNGPPGPREYLSKIAIMHSLRYSHPYINKPNARDHPPDKTLIQNEFQMGQSGEQRVFCPKTGPGKHHHQHTSPDGDGNLDHKQQALRPDRRVSGGRDELAGIFFRLWWLRGLLQWSHFHRRFDASLSFHDWHGVITKTGCCPRSPQT